MRHISLFNGIGGFQLAAHWMRWENIASCEIDEWCNTITKYYWPECKQHGDIKTTDFTIYRGECDILTGGFPCQPYSAAGLQKGKEDERHLWPEMLRAIRELQPRWVVGENVRGLTNWNGGLVFDEVQADLEAIGYEVTPFLLPACAVNAPHRRDRIWFVAYANSDGQQWGYSQHEKHTGERRQHAQRDTQPGIGYRATTNTGSERQQSGWVYDREHDRAKFAASSEHYNEKQSATNPEGKQSKRAGFIEQSEPGQQEQGQPGRSDSKDVVTDTNGIGLRRESNGAGSAGQLNKTSAPDNWENFPTQPPVCGGDDGLPRELDGITFSKWRNNSIKAYGNAIVPQVALQIFKAIEQYEFQKQKEVVMK